MPNALTRYVKALVTANLIYRCALRSFGRFTSLTRRNLSAVSHSFVRRIKQHYCLIYLIVYLECLVIVVFLKESHIRLYTGTFEVLWPSSVHSLLNLLKYSSSPVPRGQLSSPNVRETVFCKRIVINIFVAFSDIKFKNKFKQQTNKPKRSLHAIKWNVISYVLKFLYCKEYHITELSLKELLERKAQF